MSTKFIAWDIGIKNLAYNIIDYTPETPYKIVDWGIINLIDSEHKMEGIVEYIECHGESKLGKKCTKKVKYLKHDNYNVGYCTTHAKQMHDFLSMKVILNKSICIQTMIKQKVQVPCQKRGIWKQKQNPYVCYCSVHYKSSSKKDNFKVDDYYLDPKVANKVKQFNIKDLSISLFNELDKRPYLLDVSHVVIENQPVHLNPMMKSMQMMLYSWFVIHGVQQCKINNISFFMAGKKLNAFMGNHDIAKQKFSHLKSDYQKTKKSGVLFCRQMLQEYKELEWLSFLNEQHKKDDLADAYLTNCCYIQTHVIKDIAKNSSKGTKPKGIKDKGTKPKVNKKSNIVDDVNDNDNNNDN